MRISSLSLFCFFFWVLFYVDTVVADDEKIISRSDFPPGFFFGAGTSAYQVEGAVAEDGRKPGIWDTFTHAGKALDKSTGDIASIQYHKYKEDVELMHKMGLDAYRFSISWSRVIPGGRGAVNPKGLNYYNNLIDELISHGIEPHVTLSHFDIPQALQDDYNGYVSRKLVKDFTAYADVCFKEFGDRVKFWITFNEPNAQTVLGNDVGIIAPGRCSYPFGFNCSEGDSTTEPYLGAHNIFLSHAAAVHLYRKKYQEKQKGQIGITILAMWLEPISDSQQDIFATQRALDFHIGWFLDPLVYGNYPATMRKIIGSRLPFFTENESKQLKGSFDFIGLNHYSVLYVQDYKRSFDNYASVYIRDISVRLAFTDGLLEQDFTMLKATIPMPMVSWDLQRLLEYVKINYNNPAVVIHENGYRSEHDSFSPSYHMDTDRVEYLQAYIESLLLSIRNGSDALGYFVWSFLDCFEVVGGYTAQYGLYGVNFTDKDQKRYPRQSAQWYSTFLSKLGSKTETSVYLYRE